ncbi:MAG TPA: hypothetical protein VL326_22545 [Kofleriaceae bacterium]|jgi:hypothetical protein|nr:hypothetical protein [Kofleriaceae bacterium]
MAITEEQFRKYALAFPGVQERSPEGQFPEFRVNGRIFASMKRPRPKRPADGAYFWGLGEARIQALASSRLRGTSIAGNTLRVELAALSAASVKKLLAEAHANTSKPRKR